jgi:6-pyruvoyltetrahydropterin/6-carboxytetrahydropterin synthase
MEISRSFQIEAAHLLPNAPEGHRCRRLHGHSFSITVTISGEIDEKHGWVLDFAEIDAAFAPVMEALDHRFLNDVEGLENPTSEKLAIWIWEALRGQLPQLHAVEVGETCRSAARFRGPTGGNRS